LANSLRDSFGPGIRAIREQIRPFLLIQVSILCLAAGYYLSPGFASIAESLGHLKAQGGLVASFFATMFAGMVLPELFKLISRSPDRLDGPALIFVGLVFGFDGIMADLFYRLQGIMFGSELSLLTVAIKVVVDQLVAAPFVFSPYFVLTAAFRDARFSLASVRESLKRVSLFQRILPLLVVNWLFWIPALCGVYAMPPNLQFVLFLFVVAAWSLIVVHVTRNLKHSASVVVE